MQQQLAINPCVCGKSNAICPVHPPLSVAPTNLIVPTNLILPIGPLAVMREDFDDDMELADTKWAERMRKVNLDD